jgi:hypothetical protein
MSTNHAAFTIENGVIRCVCGWQTPVTADGSHIAKQQEHVRHGEQNAAIDRGEPAGWS